MHAVEESTGGRGALIKKRIAYNQRRGQNSAQLDVELISGRQRVYQKLQRQQESPAANGSKASTPQGAGSSNQHAASNRLHAVRGSKHNAAGSTQQAAAAEAVGTELSAYISTRTDFV